MILTNLIDCLYLYREFASEALRILVPYTKSGVDEASVQSFMAALQLGLKRRFGGKVDHLRMVPQEERARTVAASRHYVMLYDSVPGGTGYLHELLAHDAGTLVDVLRMALEPSSACSCNADPEKDGCYRCVYQYRLGRDMALVSRDRARAVLESWSKTSTNWSGSRRSRTSTSTRISTRCWRRGSSKACAAWRRRRAAVCEAGAGHRAGQVGLPAGGRRPTLLDRAASGSGA